MSNRVFIYTFTSKELFEFDNVLYYQCTAHGNMGGAIFISHNSGSNIPNGTVSGSEQITDLGFINWNKEAS